MQTGINLWWNFSIWTMEEIAEEIEWLKLYKVGKNDSHKFLYLTLLYSTMCLWNHGKN